MCTENLLSTFRSAYMAGCFLVAPAGGTVAFSTAWNQHMKHSEPLIVAAQKV